MLRSNTAPRELPISILDFTLFKDTNEYYSCFHIREDKRNTVFTDKMEFHVLELPKLPKTLKETTDDLLLWAKFINSERKEDFDMIAEKDPYINSAYKQLQFISQDKQKRLEYEAREKAVRDYNQGMFEAEQRGEQRGIQIGEQRGERRINTLNDILLNSNRIDDLKRAAVDKAFQTQLMKELLPEDLL